MNQLAPVAYFVYNRPEHTKISLNALKNNELAKHTRIIIYSDAPKNYQEDKSKVSEVRDIIEQIEGFKEKKIIIRDKNFGLYRNFVEGITEVCDQYGKVIVVEDDNKTSKFFLNFINDGLNMYENEKSICTINGWFFSGKNNLNETFFVGSADTWGWGTWKRAWDNFNPDTEFLLNEIKRKKLIKKFNLNNAFDYYKMLEKRHNKLNESWTIIWKASTLLKNMLSLRTSKSLVENIGFDGSGTHNKKPDNFYNDKLIYDYFINVKKIEIKENLEAVKFFENFYRRKNFLRLLKRPINKIFRFFGQ